jgi:hypothetical protein
MLRDGRRFDWVFYFCLVLGGILFFGRGDGWDNNDMDGIIMIDFSDCKRGQDKYIKIF